MADLFLIISMIVAFVLLIIIGIYCIIYYQHPDDHNDAYFPKLIVLGGFVLSGVTVLLLPLDVANREGYPGTL
jgi:LMBR1 domain-containing protein 1